MIPKQFRAVGRRTADIENGEALPSGDFGVPPFFAVAEHANLECAGVIAVRGVANLVP